ncbi:MAG: LD-carboxypeptidase [Prevotella sp.]|nr:LD-carboxypeptidase [Prevotella sp.]
MKRFVLLWTLLLMLIPVSAQWLHEGDTIAIISPSSATDTATINGGIRTLEQWGFHTVVGPHALNDYRGFAGKIEERRADLLWALRNPTVKAIMCSRGGDGAVHLLCELPLGVFRKYPKLLIGFSDITALLCAKACAGQLGIHGSMCHAIGAYEGNDTVSQVLRRMMTGDLPVYRLPHHPLDHSGKATGILVGGNMSVMHGLAGSDYDPLTLPDIILFLEDTGESMTKVDRMLHNIEVRGLMSHVRGVIIGQFTNYKKVANTFPDMNHMFFEYLRRYNIPVCYDFPVGHKHLRNYPMLVGSLVTLEVNGEGTTLTFSCPSY